MRLNKRFTILLMFTLSFLLVSSLVPAASEPITVNAVGESMSNPIELDKSLWGIQSWIQENTTLPGPASDDSIWYNLTFYARTWYRFNLSVADTLEATFEVYDSSGTLLLSNSQTTYPLSSEVELAPDFYYINVIPTSGSGSFELLIEFMGQSYDDTIDGIVDGKIVASLPTSVMRYELYYLYGLSAGSYEINLTSPYLSDFDLYIYNESKHQIAFADSGDSIHSLTLDLDGLYYIKVDRYAGGGEFNLEVTTQLQQNGTVDDPFTETIIDAITLSGNISPTPAIYYNLSLTYQGAYQFNLTSDLDMYVEILNDNGKKLSTLFTDNRVTKILSMSGNTTIVLNTNEAGIYNIEITRLGNGFDNPIPLSDNANYIKYMSTAEFPAHSGGSGSLMHYQSTTAFDYIRIFLTGYGGSQYNMVIYDKDGTILEIIDAQNNTNTFDLDVTNINGVYLEVFSDYNNGTFTVISANLGTQHYPYTFDFTRNSSTYYYNYDFIEGIQPGHRYYNFTTDIIGNYKFTLTGVTGEYLQVFVLSENGEILAQNASFSFSSVYLSNINGSYLVQIYSSNSDFTRLSVERLGVYSAAVMEFGKVYQGEIVDNQAVNQLTYSFEAIPTTAYNITYAVNSSELLEFLVTGTEIQEAITTSGIGSVIVYAKSDLVNIEIMGNGDNTGIFVLEVNAIASSLASAPTYSFDEIQQNDVYLRISPTQVIYVNITIDSMGDYFFRVLAQNEPNYYFDIFLHDSSGKTLAYIAYYTSGAQNITTLVGTQLQPGTYTLSISQYSSDKYRNAVISTSYAGNTWDETVFITHKQYLSQPGASGSLTTERNSIHYQSYIQNSGTYILELSGTGDISAVLYEESVDDPFDTMWVNGAGDTSYSFIPGSSYIFIQINSTGAANFTIRLREAGISQDTALPASFGSFNGAAYNSAPIWYNYTIYEQTGVEISLSFTNAPSDLKFNLFVFDGAGEVVAYVAYNDSARLAELHSPGEYSIMLQFFIDSSLGYTLNINQVDILDDDTQSSQTSTEDNSITSEETSDTLASPISHLWIIAGMFLLPAMLQRNSRRKNQ